MNLSNRFHCNSPTLKNSWGAIAELQLRFSAAKETLVELDSIEAN